MGALLSYGPHPLERWRRAAFYVDKLLRGANAAELPVEQPSTFELVINLKVAQSLGLTIPPSLLLQADNVIQSSATGPRSRLERSHGPMMGPAAWQPTRDA